MQEIDLLGARRKHSINQGERGLRALTGIFSTLRHRVGGCGGRSLNEFPPFVILFNFFSVLRKGWLHSWTLYLPPLSWWCFKQTWTLTANNILHNGVIMSAMASQITSLTIVYSTVYSGTEQRKHQSSASLAFVRRIHRWPMNSPHKWPVTRGKSFHLMTPSCKADRNGVCFASQTNEI